MSYQRVSQQGNVIEITSYYPGVNRSCRIKKLNKDSYLDLETGEVREYEHRAENRSQSKKSLLRTFKTLRGIINTNCSDPKKLKWVTLTYREKMWDTEQLKTDFNNFWKRFKRRYPNTEYIAVAEPQREHAWHYHVLIVFDDNAPYISNSVMEKLWGKGFTRTKKVDEIDNVGAYLSSYLTDLPVDSDEEETVGVEKEVDGQKKKFIKGGRLHLYPNGMNIYRCSRGIKKPTYEWLEYDEWRDLITDTVLTYESERVIESDEGYKMVVKKRYYNTKRDGEKIPSPIYTSSGELIPDED